MLLRYVMLASLNSKGTALHKDISYFTSIVLFRFRVVPGSHGWLQSRPAMASSAFCFLSEGSPWLCTWTSLVRLLFALHCVGTATKRTRMSGVEHVFVFFLAGPGTLPGRSLLVSLLPGTPPTILSTLGRCCSRVYIGRHTWDLQTIASVAMSLAKAWVTVLYKTILFSITAKGN